MAMGTYYRTSGKLSASIVTTGAGSTNAVTGVVSCWMDSIPGIVISGNEKSVFTTEENDLRIWGVQGYDSVAMVEKKQLNMPNALLMRRMCTRSLSVQEILPYQEEKGLYGLIFRWTFKPRESPCR